MPQTLKHSIVVDPEGTPIEWGIARHEWDAPLTIIEGTGPTGKILRQDKTGDLALGVDPDGNAQAIAVDASAHALKVRDQQLYDRLDLIGFILFAGGCLVVAGLSRIGALLENLVKKDEPTT